jgi:hypothetical protein
MASGFALKRLVPIGIGPRGENSNHKWVLSDSGGEAAPARSVEPAGSFKASSGG